MWPICLTRRKQPSSSKRPPPPSMSSHMLSEILYGYSRLGRAKRWILKQLPGRLEGPPLFQPKRLSRSIATKAKEPEMIRKVEMERFTVTSSKPFDAVIAAIKASIGHPNTAELWQATQRATTAAELEAAIQPVLGESGLMQFVEFDHGMIVRKGTENHTSRIIRLVIGNPLIMKEMAKHVADAGSYAPVTVLVDERADGVHISYDRMASLLAPYGNRDALSIARDLDAKVEDVLRQAAA